MKRIIKAKIKFLSLVPKGANQMPVLYKADDSFVAEMLVKATDIEHGELVACVYAPELRDSQGEIASAEVIKDMMYDAAKEGVSIDLKHNEQPVSKDKAYVAESFLIQKGDPRFAGLTTYDGKAVDPTGGWGVVLKIEDPDLRKLYKDGKWNGVSMGGQAVRQVEKSDDTAQRIIDALASRLNLRNTYIHGSIDMTGQELADALAKNNESLTKSISEAVAKALTPPKTDPQATPLVTGAVKADDAAPVFKGEPTVENLKKHRIAVKRYNILKGIDWTNEESVAKAETDLAALESETAAAPAAKAEGVTDTEAGIANGDSAEVADLKRKLAKAQKASNQPATTPPATGNAPSGQFVGLTKEQADEAAVGLKMADAMNKGR